MGGRQLQLRDRMKNLNIRVTECEYRRIRNAKYKYEIQSGTTARSWSAFILHLIAKRRKKQ